MDLEELNFRKITIAPAEEVGGKKVWQVLYKNGDEQMGVIVRCSDILGEEHNLNHAFVPVDMGAYGSAGLNEISVALATMDIKRHGETQAQEN